MKLLFSQPKPGAASPKFSSTGDRIFSVYVGSTTVAAELLNRKLKIVASIPVSAERFTAIQGGDASPAFDKFTLLDSDANNVGRLRLFTLNAKHELNIIAEQLFTSTHFFLGGRFSSDGKYIAITFVNTALSTPDKQISTLAVLKADTTLDIVSTTSFPYHTNGAYFLQGKFHLSKSAEKTKETFIVIPSGNSSANPPFLASPAFLSVYHLKKRKIDLITKAALPQYPNVCDVFVRNTRAYIAIGTRAAFLPNEATIVNTNQHDSFLANDGDEIRLYSFSPIQKLQLQYSGGNNAGIAPMVYCKQRDLLLIGYNPINPGPVVLSLFSFVELTSKEEQKLELQPFTGPVFDSDSILAASFSGSGHLLTTGGSTLSLWQLPKEKEKPTEEASKSVWRLRLPFTGSTSKKENSSSSESEQDDAEEKQKQQ